MDHRSRRVLERLFRRRLIKHPDARPHPPLPIWNWDLRTSATLRVSDLRPRMLPTAPSFSGFSGFFDHQPQNIK